MEKISSIIPASARVTSVNMETSPPVRSGVEGYGRKQVAPARNDQAFTHASSIQSGLKTYSDLKSWREQERQNAEQARRMADKFFVNQSPPTEPRPEIMSEVPVRQLLSENQFEDRPSLNSFKRDSLHNLSNREMGQKVYFPSPTPVEENATDVDELASSPMGEEKT